MGCARKFRSVSFKVSSRSLTALKKHLYKSTTWRVLVFRESRLLVIFSLNDQFPGASRSRVNPQCLVNSHQRRLRVGALAHMNRAPIGATQACSHPALHAERLPERGPGIMDPGLFQFFPQHLHTLIGQHRDEQMPVHPVLPGVKHRTQPSSLFKLRNTLSSSVSRV